MICPICQHSDSDKPRSLKQLKLYWKMLEIISEYADAPVFQGRDGQENLHETIKQAMGYVKPIYDMNGNVTGYKASSIAVHKMPHDKFNEFFDKAQSFVFEHIAPNIEKESFERELCNMLGMPSICDY